MSEEKISQMTEVAELPTDALLEVSVPDGSGGYNTNSVKSGTLVNVHGDAGNVVENPSFEEIKTDRDFEESPGSFRPIYKKMVDIPTLGGSQGTRYDVNHNIANISKIVYITGRAYNTTGYDNAVYHLPRTGDDWFQLYATPTTIAYMYNRDWSSYSFTAYIEYTKTTDTPTSTPRNVKIGSGGNFTKDLFLLDANISITGQSIPDSTETIILFDEININSSQNYNASTGEWIAPRDMDLTVNCGCFLEGVADGTWAILHINHNNIIVASHNEIMGDTRYPALTTNKVLRVSTGDSISISLRHINGSSVNIYTGEKKSTFFQITELIAGTFDPSNIITGAVELENDEYICDGTENSVTIDVSNFESDDLEILANLRTDRTGSTGWDRVHLRFNNDSGANYDCVATGLRHDNTAANDISEDGLGVDSIIIDAQSSDLDANLVSAIRLTLVDFKNSNSYKVCLGESMSHTASMYTVSNSGLWKNTDPITAITLTPYYGTKFIAGSRIKIYGKQTSAYPVVEGNEITVMQKIREIDVASDTTSIEFAGLDGDKDTEYKIIANVTSALSGNTNIHCYPNNDTGANYSYQYTAATNTSVSAGRSSGQSSGFDIACIRGANLLTISETLIRAKSGKRRMAFTSRGGESSSGVADFDESIVFVWNNETSNISNLTLAATQTNGIGAGSHFELWAVRTVKIGGSNQNDMVGAIVTTGEYDTSAGSVGGNTMYYPSSITKEYDSGNCYDTSTGTFTAPESGWYRINLWLSFGAVSGRNIWNLQKNGDTANYPTEFYDMNVDNYLNSSCSLTKKMEKGDTYRFLNRRDVIASYSQQEFIKIG